MKLVDILARELKAWPENSEQVWQSLSGRLFLGKDRERLTVESYTLAKDWDEARVTRAGWQAAVEALKAEQAAELKWPEGAEFFGTSTEDQEICFYRNLGLDEFEFMYRDDEDGWQDGLGVPLHLPLIPRPTERAVEWDGDGEPPAGTECAVLNSALGDPAWERCTILYYGKHRVMYDSESCEERVAFIQDLKFRKAKAIRTQEQIAAEEREKAIEEMILLDEKGSLSRTHFCGLLYDAGYGRKQVAK